MTQSRHLNHSSQTDCAPHIEQIGGQNRQNLGAAVLTAAQSSHTDQL